MIEVNNFDTVKAYRQAVHSLINDIIVRKQLNLKQISQFLGITQVNLSKAWTGAQSMSGPAFYRLLCLYSLLLPGKCLDDTFHVISLFDDAFSDIPF